VASEVSAVTTAFNSVHYSISIMSADNKVTSIFSDQDKLSAIEASDFALFAATWWPKANYEELTVLLYFAIWLFIWDDEMDEPTGLYSEDLEGAKRYRMRTTDFVLKCLNLPGHGRGPELEPSQEKIIASFRGIGEPLAKVYTISMFYVCGGKYLVVQLVILLTASQGQRQRFMHELTRFLEHTKQEQRFRLLNQIPSVEEYWSFRMGSSAVGLVLAVQE
jgi:hypothetical protein